MFPAKQLTLYIQYQILKDVYSGNHLDCVAVSIQCQRAVKHSDGLKWR